MCMCEYMHTSVVPSGLRGTRSPEVQVVKFGVRAGNPTPAFRMNSKARSELPRSLEFLF